MANCRLTAEERELLRQRALETYRRELRGLSLAQLDWDLSCSVPDWMRAELQVEKRRRLEGEDGKGAPAAESVPR